MTTAGATELTGDDREADGARDKQDRVKNADHRGDRPCEQAKSQKLKKLFVLTTRTADWFRERGFQAADISFLPAKKQGLYNYSRQSKVFIKDL